MSKFYWDEIQKIAKAHHIEDPLSNLETFQRFLEFWWSRKFNRPLKDPLLQQYTLEELAYEWLRNVYTIPEHDPKKELEKKVAEDDDMEWIKAQLEKHVKQSVAQKSIEATPEVTPDVTPDVEEVAEIPDLPDIDTSFE